jgi:MSHA biogenesis protein MshO
MNRLRGFTLVEMIMVIVITGIIAGMVAVFIAKPVTGYVDSVRRAGMTDVADLALKRMAMEIRTAVPNSVRVNTTGKFLEFIPARTGGRYCTDSDACPSGTSGALSFTDANDYFDVLGPAHDVIDSDFLVIYNTGQSGLNAYVGDNLRDVDTHTATGITLLGVNFPYASPSNRFQAVPSTGPVTFACENVAGTTTGTGSLRRYTGYNTGYNTGGTSPSPKFSTTQPISGLGTGALIADNLSACTFTYDTVSAATGLVSLSLTLTREGESITLFSQIHVDNMP